MCVPDDVLFSSALPGCVHEGAFVALTCVFAVIFSIFTYMSVMAARVRYLENKRDRARAGRYLFSAATAVVGLASVVLNATPVSSATKMFFFKSSITTTLIMCTNMLFVLTKLLVDSVVTKNRANRRASRRVVGAAPSDVQSAMTLSWRDPFTAVMLSGLFSSIALTIIGSVVGVVDVRFEDAGVTTFSVGVAVFAVILGALVRIQASKMYKYVQGTIEGVKRAPSKTDLAASPRFSSPAPSSGRDASSLGASGKQKTGFEDFLKRLRIVRDAALIIGVLSAVCWALHAALVLKLYWFMTFVHYANLVALVSLMLFFFTRQSMVYKIFGCCAPGGVGPKSDASSVRPTTAEVASATTQTV